MFKNKQVFTVALILSVFWCVLELRKAEESRVREVKFAQGYAMKKYMGFEAEFYITWSFVVSFTPLLPYRRGTAADTHREKVGLIPEQAWTLKGR
jgi:hypothetical protein